jgi:hypothetical protein
MIKSIYEVLNQANNIKNVDERIEFLNKNNSSALQTILKCTYDSTIEWLLPEGNPSYKENQNVDSHGMLRNNSNLRKFKIFIKNNGYDTLDKTKRENIFIDLLETVDKDDAKIILAAKNRKLPFRKLNKAFIRKAFPTLLEDSENDEEKE